MYFVFNCGSIYWRDRELFAQLHIDDVQASLYAQHEWWDCQPLSKPMPIIRFRIEANAPRPDAYITGTPFQLCSAKLRQALHEEDVQFESFPCSLLDVQTNLPIAHDYEVFHFFDCFPAFDPEHSIRGKWGMKKIVLSQEILTSQPLLVRVATKQNLVLIHARLKEKLETIGITGCEYIPVEEYDRSEIRLNFSPKI